MFRPQPARCRADSDEPTVRLSRFIQLDLHASSPLGDFFEVRHFDGKVRFTVVQIVDSNNSLERNAKRDLRVHFLESSCRRAVWSVCIGPRGRGRYGRKSLYCLGLITESNEMRFSEHEVLIASPEHSSGSLHFSTPQDRISKQVSDIDGASYAFIFVRRRSI